MRPAIERIREGVLSAARSWEFAGIFEAVFDEDHPDMREAGGSTDLKPSKHQHAQDQHEGNAYRKGVRTDK